MGSEETGNQVLITVDDEATMSENEIIKEDALEAEIKLRSGEIFSGRKLFIAWCTMLGLTYLFGLATVLALLDQDQVYLIIEFSFIFLGLAVYMVACFVVPILFQTKAYVQAKLLIRKAKHLEYLETLTVN
ncbi:hypothetical protein POM88_019979 [Heracleum sosnowskyi]|uniref:Uncharacterized protein n=1 Tax=Heracleum sosnowskyi TaxID=360622 RepID=A0AAD8IBW4_9APIA|nr:hypothetical protein POM88_019979 [Heracleum sosnowskyi]